MMQLDIIYVNKIRHVYQIRSAVVVDSVAP
jgi:hypothetical protein